MDEALLVIDKAVGPTSFDVVRKVKRLVPGVKVGHSGSLDPFASGTLVLLLGRATKLSGLLLNADKIYHATMKLGVATDALDCTGKVVDEKPVPALTEEVVAKTLAGFQGTWNQVPPMFSAKKIQGVRLYELARKQIAVPREPVPVELHELKLLKFEGDVVEFYVHCSKGTYVRSLAAELAERLGTVGHLTALRRLACGPYKLEEALTLEQLTADVTGALANGYRQYVRLVREEMILRRNGNNGLSEAGGRFGRQVSV